MNNGKVVAGLIAGSVTILLIGILHLLAESVEVVHDFLEFLPAYGTLSGKIVVSYSLGLILYAVLSIVLRNKNPRLIPWVWAAGISLVIASLFVFTPFVELII